MNDITVKISIIDPVAYANRGCKVPQYHSEGASGLDLYACIKDPIRLDWGDRVLISTGIKLEIPSGYEGQVRSRSGAAVNGIVVANAPGTIDSDYRGEIRVLITNIARTEFQDETATGGWILPGTRLAQLVIAPVAHANLVIDNNLTPTVRGESGFGSTGGMGLDGASGA